MNISRYMDINEAPKMAMEMIDGQEAFSVRQQKNDRIAGAFLTCSCCCLFTFLLPPCNDLRERIQNNSKCCCEDDVDQQNKDFDKDRFASFRKKIQDSNQDDIDFEDLDSNFEKNEAVQNQIKAVKDIARDIKGFRSYFYKQMTRNLGDDIIAKLDVEVKFKKELEENKTKPQTKSPKIDMDKELKTLKEEEMKSLV